MLDSVVSLSSHPFPSYHFQLTLNPPLLRQSMRPIRLIIYYIFLFGCLRTEILLEIEASNARKYVMFILLFHSILISTTVWELSASNGAVYSSHRLVLCWRTSGHFQLIFGECVPFKHFLKFHHLQTLTGYRGYMLRNRDWVRLCWSPSSFYQLCASNTHIIKKKILVKNFKENEALIDVQQNLLIGGIKTFWIALKCGIDSKFWIAKFDSCRFFKDHWYWANGEPWSGYTNFMDQSGCKFWYNWLV